MVAGSSELTIGNGSDGAKACEVWLAVAVDWTTSTTGSVSRAARLKMGRREVSVCARIGDCSSMPIQRKSGRLIARLERSGEGNLPQPLWNDA